EKNATETIREYITEIKKRDYIKGVWLYDLIDDGADKSNKEHNFGMFYQDMQPKSSALQIKSLKEQ
ncbi:glycosyl hydrolase, partial [Klebsiella pneumoniae]|nr:glycosyl hydrolase [Klebsiella pneumoniae]